MLKLYTKHQGRTDQLFVLYKIDEAGVEVERKVAAKKWAETDEELQKRAEKHAENRRTTWFETTVRDLHALSGLYPHQDAIIGEVGWGV
jgi:adenosyl cobinamide kinase/adenosyl cobinamide phosphate guanylyltransferase